MQGYRARAYACFNNFLALDPGCVYNRLCWEGAKAAQQAQALVVGFISLSSRVGVNITVLFLIVSMLVLSVTLVALNIIVLFLRGAVLFWFCSGF